MKLICLQENLSRALAITDRIVPDKAIMPIIKCVLLNATKDTLTLLTTDLGATITYNIPAQVEEEGECCVLSGLFTESIKYLQNQPVVLHTKKQLMADCGKTKKRFDVTDSKQFPRLQAVEGDVITVDARQLAPAISKVLISTGQDRARAILTGILLEVDTHINLCSGDGFRLSFCKVPIIEGTSTQRVVVLPEPLSILKNILGDGVVTITLSPSRVSFAYDNIVITSQLLAGTYPHVIQMIPKTSQTTAEVSKQELVRAVNSASVIAKEGLKQLKFTVTKDQLKVSAETAQVGLSEEEMSAVTTGLDCEVLFDMRFIQDWLKVQESELVQLDLNRSAPNVFKPVNQDGLYLVMPYKS